MNTDMRTKVLIRFWYLESLGCKNETKNATCTVPIYIEYTHKMLILTQTEVTNTVYTTQAYEYSHDHENDLIFVPVMLQVS